MGNESLVHDLDPLLASCLLPLGDHQTSTGQPGNELPVALPHFAAGREPAGVESGFARSYQLHENPTSLVFLLVAETPERLLGVAGQGLFHASHRVVGSMGEL